MDSLNICSVFILAAIAPSLDKLFVIEIAEPVADTSNNTHSLVLGSLNEIIEYFEEFCKYHHITESQYFKKQESLRNLEIWHKIDGTWRLRTELV